MITKKSKTPAFTDKELDILAWSPKIGEWYTVSVSMVVYYRVNGEDLPTNGKDYKVFITDVHLPKEKDTSAKFEVLSNFGLFPDLRKGHFYLYPPRSEEGARIWNFVLKPASEV